MLQMMMQRVVTRRRDAVMVTGWPSFSDLMKEESITKADDFSYGMHRVEATCSQVHHKLHQQLLFTLLLRGRQSVTGLTQTDTYSILQSVWNRQ